MSMRSDCQRELIALVLLALLPQPAAAAWPSDPTANVPLGAASGRQSDQDAAADATGGAIVAWEDHRSGFRDIYIQRVDGTGAPRWTADGLALCTATGEQYSPKIVADGSGGAFVTWVDWRGAAQDIYAQRVDSSGTPLWTANGVPLCSAVNHQNNQNIIPDGSGGAIVTWEDNRAGNSTIFYNPRVYAQRVNGSGVPQWTANGVAVANFPSGETRPVLVSNGAGGAIIAWKDYRNGEYDIFAQRILANGAVDPAWPAGGRAVALYWGDQDGLVLAVDGSGGAFVAWAQSDGATRDIFIHHLLVSGALDPAWPAAGKALVADYFDQSSPAIMPDGAGGALVSWDDQRGTGRDIYAQHVLASGAFDPAWPATGLSLSAGALGDQAAPKMVSDGAAGAIVAWRDPRNDVGDIYAQHVTSMGTLDPAWPAAGRAITTAALRQSWHSIVADGAGGAVVAWQDHRAGADEFDEDSDIYAQGVKGSGQLGEEPVGVPGAAGLALALSPPSPNPTRAGAMLLRFTLPGDAAASLELFNVAGRRIVAREVGSFGAGRHAVDLAAGRRLDTGIYFVRLQQGGNARVQRVVVLEE